MTAHFIGGCAIGDSPADRRHRRLPPRSTATTGLHVVDGSTLSANLGVNPSLTITAQAERAMALWPNKGEADPRPPLGAAYQRLDAGRAASTRRAGRRPRRPAGDAPDTDCAAAVRGAGSASLSRGSALRRARPTRRARQGTRRARERPPHHAVRVTHTAGPASTRPTTPCA